MTINSVTTTSAVAAVSSPWWLPLLNSASELAGLIFPILGVLLLLIQIGLKVYSVWKYGPVRRT